MAALSALHDIAMPYGLPVARVLLAAVFLYSGQDKLRHWHAGVSEVAELGLPWPHLFTGATIAVQLLGGLAVALGIGAAFGAALLAAFTIAATLVGHRFWLHHGKLARTELTTSLEHLAIVGGLLLVILNALQKG
jgi:putative oxidoreductase